MKAKSKKIWLAAITALVGAAGDISVQLISLGEANIGRAAIIGLLVGAVVRVAGAILSNIETTDA